MKGFILAAAVACGLGFAAAGPAQAIGPAAPDGIAGDVPVTQASAARERRLYMMRSIQRQQLGYYGGYGRPRGYGYGGGYGRPRGYGYGGGYGRPRGYGYGGGYGSRW